MSCRKNGLKKFKQSYQAIPLEEIRSSMSYGVLVYITVNLQFKLLHPYDLWMQESSISAGVMDNKGTVACVTV
jgi:hypothetical protein